MTGNNLIQLKKSFKEFVESYFLDDPEDQRNITLKIHHTEKVCGNAAIISKEHGLEIKEILTAECIALLHDIGRFPQYAQYRTFNDSDSVNHGQLGARILQEQNFLQDIPLRDKELIITAVNFHNCYGIPNIEDKDKILHLRLIRDADKLDIWRVFSEYYEGNLKERASAVNLGFHDHPGYSKVALKKLSEEKLIALTDITTLNDFKLMQLSWIYDLNFHSSFRLLKERHLIERITSTLPKDREITDAVSAVTDYANEKIKGI